MASTERLLELLRTGPKTNYQLAHGGVLCYTAAISAARKRGAVILRTGDMFRRSTWTYSLVKDPGTRHQAAAGGGER